MNTIERTKAENIRDIINDMTPQEREYVMAYISGMVTMKLLAPQNPSETEKTESKEADAIDDNRKS